MTELEDYIADNDSENTNEQPQKERRIYGESNRRCAWPDCKTKIDDDKTYCFFHSMDRRMFRNRMRAKGL